MAVGTSKHRKIRVTAFNDSLKFSMARIRIRNEWMEQHLFRVRAVVVGAIALILLVVVGGRLIDLQLINYSHFATLA